MGNNSLHTISTRSVTNGAFWAALCSGGVALTLFAVIAPQLRQLPNLKHVPAVFSKNYFWTPLATTGVALFAISLLGARFSASDITASKTIARFLNDKGVADSFFHHIHSFSDIPSFKAQEAESTLEQVRKNVGKNWKQGIDVNQPLGREVRLAYEVLFAHPHDLRINGTPINPTQQLHLFFAMLDRVPQAEGYDQAVEDAKTLLSSNEDQSCNQIHDDDQNALSPYDQLESAQAANIKHIYYFTKVCYAVTQVDHSDLRRNVVQQITQDKGPASSKKVSKEFKNQTTRRFLTPENKVVSKASTSWIGRLLYGEHFAPVESGNVPTRLGQNPDAGYELLRAGCAMKDTGLFGSRFHGWTQGLIDYHYLNGQTFLYVNHQNAKPFHTLTKPFESEPVRVARMLEGGGVGPQGRRNRNQNTMLVVSLPMNGPIYMGKDPTNPSGLKTAVLYDMFNNATFRPESEFSLPVAAIQRRYQVLHPDGELDIKQLVTDSLDYVVRTYFKENENLDATKRQAFLLLFYANLTHRIAEATQSPLHWKACKNAIDRAMINNVIALCMQNSNLNDNEIHSLLQWPGLSIRGRYVHEKHLGACREAINRIQPPPVQALEEQE